jgi:hypothetical protein
VVSTRSVTVSGVYNYGTRPEAAGWAPRDGLEDPYLGGSDFAGANLTGERVSTGYRGAGRLEQFRVVAHVMPRSGADTGFLHGGPGLHPGLAGVANNVFLGHAGVGVTGWMLYALRVGNRVGAAPVGNRARSI